MAENERSLQKRPEEQSNIVIDNKQIMDSEKARGLPVVTEMPIITSQIWQSLLREMEAGGDGYFWSLGADLTRANPEHREAYEEALRNSKPSEVPDATMATVLLVLRALDLQAKADGYQLPEIPSPIDPLPALQKFILRAQGEEFKIIDIAYEELLKENPVIGEIVLDMGVGAPDELLRIATETQAKRGAVYAFYGVKAVIPRMK